MRMRNRTCRLTVEILENRCTPSTFAAFDLANPDSGPFPSDRFTVADASQLTGRRVDLPLPDHVTRPSDYDDISVINTLDGFNLQPRLSVAFSGPIDVNTVNSNTVFLIKLADPTAPEAGGGEVVGINQTVWDVATNTLHVESDELLDQHARYALIVTRGVHDAAGQPVEPSDAYARFRHDLNFGQTHDPTLKEYGKELLDALQAARGVGVAEKDIVTASVFTTQSATAILEKMRDQIHAATPAAADFLLGANGARTLFNLDGVSGVTWNQQTRVAGPLNAVPVNVNLLRFIPGTVGQIAFGKYVSPDYETAEKFIPPVGTQTGTPVVQGVNEVFFNLYLPSGPEPAAGWPVAIFGHGVGGSKQGAIPAPPGGGDSLALAASLAEQGIATIAINVVGSGFGPLSTLTVTPSVGAPVTFLEGGRGTDQNGDGIIANNEGISAAAPRSIIGDRDGQRQTVADLMQLVRVIEVGMDADGNGVADLDPSRIYYLGQSLGGIYGTTFLAVEPDVHVGALNVAGGVAGGNRLSPIFRAAVGTSLAARTPSLLNGPGVTTLDGVSVLGKGFDENMPLRDGVPLTVRLADGTERVIQSPVINTVPGAMPIQEVIEHAEWVSQAGNPVAYAPHIRKTPLAGVPAKSVIFQFAEGDQIVPNPAATALLRAGDLADRATFYRHDLAFAENPLLPTNPHAFLTRLDVPGFRAIIQGAQQQIATFFASDGVTVIHPEPARFFETPIAGALPEGLNFITGPLPKTLLTISNVTVTASDTGTVTAVFTVSLSAPSSQPVTVNYATADGTATAGGNVILGNTAFANGVANIFIETCGALKPWQIDSGVTWGITNGHPVVATSVPPGLLIPAVTFQTSFGYVVVKQSADNLSGIREMGETDSLRFESLRVQMAMDRSDNETDGLRFQMDMDRSAKKMAILSNLSKLFSIISEVRETRILK